MKLFEGVDKGSMFPAFFYKQHIQELEEEISSIKRKLERGELEGEQVWRNKNKLSKLEHNLTMIQCSKPELSVGEKNRLEKVFEVLSDEISRALFTRTEMEKGLVHAHEEARRMKNPCIPILGAEKEIADLAAICNVKIIDKKISRDGASKLWKIAASLLNKAEYPNVEVLRKDTFQPAAIGA